MLSRKAASTEHCRLKCLCLSAEAIQAKQRSLGRPHTVCHVVDQLILRTQPCSSVRQRGLTDAFMSSQGSLPQSAIQVG